MSNANRTKLFKQALVANNEVVADETVMLNRSKHTFMLASTSAFSFRNVAHLAIDYKTETMHVAVYDASANRIAFVAIKNPKHLKRVLRKHSIIV